MEDAKNLIGDTDVVIIGFADVFQHTVCFVTERKVSNLWMPLQVGVFPIFGGGEYENFMAVAEKMRNGYDFCHTLDASSTR